jgi:hypothetical protein
MRLNTTFFSSFFPQTRTGSRDRVAAGQVVATESRRPGSVCEIETGILKKSGSGSGKNL